MYLSSLIYCNEEIKYRIGVWCEPNEVWFLLYWSGHKSADSEKTPATDFEPSTCDPALLWTSV